MFEKADWDKFEKISKERLAGIDESQDVDSLNESLNLCNSIRVNSNVWFSFKNPAVISSKHLALCVAPGNPTVSWLSCGWMEKIKSIKRFIRTGSINGAPITVLGQNRMPMAEISI